MDYDLIYYGLGAFVWTIAAIFASFIWNLPED